MFHSLTIMPVCPISLANSTSTWTRYLCVTLGSCVIVTFAPAMNPFGSTVLTVPLLNRMCVSLSDSLGSAPCRFMYTVKCSMSARLYTVNMMLTGSPGLIVCGSSVLRTPPSRYALPLMTSGASSGPVAFTGGMGSSGSNVLRSCAMSCGIDTSPEDTSAPKSRAGACERVELPPPPPPLLLLPESRTVRCSESAPSPVPSFAVRVSVNRVLEFTRGAVNVVGDEPGLAKVIAGTAGICDHVYVRGSPSASLADHGRLTGSPSDTVRSPPTSTVGRLLVAGWMTALSVMVTCRVSETSTVPSLTVRVTVTVTVVLAATSGAANVVDSAVEFANVIARAPSWVHEYVRASPGSSSEAVPERVTVAPSATSWSGPALTVGGLLDESVMVTCRVSETSTVPSSAVRVTVMVVLAATSGAANVVDSADEFANVIARAPSWVHEYVRLSSGSSSETMPERVTVAPSTTSWSAPASTSGALLGESVMVTCRVSETSTVPSSAVRVTVMVVLAATSGAANVVDSADEFANVIARAPSWVHEYVRLSSGSSSETVPERVTVAPSTTSWSAPASTSGALLGESVTCGQGDGDGVHLQGVRDFHGPVVLPSG